MATLVGIILAASIAAIQALETIGSRNELEGAKSCIEMSQLQENMPQWVGKVSYSHSVNKKWGYPTDCSGFVSYAVQAKVGHNPKAYEYASDALSKRIAKEDLQYGDIITHVWAPSWAPNRCVKKKGKKGGTDSDGYTPDISAATLKKMIMSGAGGFFDYLPGHVFFFDKWVNDSKLEFWAYESSLTQDQTDKCRKKGAKFCFNHHVKKPTKKIDKYSKDNCTSKEYGWVTGGPRRLSEKLLCQ